jgi:hypothetical protein
VRRSVLLVKEEMLVRLVLADLELPRWVEVDLGPPR